MTRIIDSSGIFRQARSWFFDGEFPTSARPPDPIEFRLNLNTPGRIGFFIDYSELSDAGTHTFYVVRTHGSQGPVSVNYNIGGDESNGASGIVSWIDGDMSVKTLSVEVTPAQLSNHQTSLNLGEHRVSVSLSKPTNGAGLQLGNKHTIAYGVIDNNIIADDSNSVFYDSAAATNGDGSSSSPYNNIYDAVSNVSSKRYLYGRGTTSIDQDPGAYGRNYIPFPATRTGESDRLYIRNWGADTWSLVGAGTNSKGFFTDQGESYITFKGLDFADMGGPSSGEIGGVQTNYGGSEGIHVELCTFNNINGSSNTAAFMPYGVDGAKMWRSTADNIQVNDDNLSQNSGGLLLHYQAKNLSVQRCRVSNSGNGMRLKRVVDTDDSGTIRFCIFETIKGIGAGFGSNTHGVNNLIVQNNIFYNCNNGGGIKMDVSSINTYGSNVISNNTFINCGNGEVAAIHFDSMKNAQIYNNIFLDCTKVWAYIEDEVANGLDIEYADFNIEFGIKRPEQRYEYTSINCRDISDVQALRPDLAGNDVRQDPLISDPLNDDFTLQVGSPALTGGIDGTQQGAYLSDFYTIGVN